MIFAFSSVSSGVNITKPYTAMPSKLSSTMSGGEPAQRSAATQPLGELGRGTVVLLGSGCSPWAGGEAWVPLQS